MKRSALFLSLLLFTVPALLIGYRVVFLGYPLFPTAPRNVWQLSMDASIRAGEKGVSVMIGVPSAHADLVVFEEKIAGDVENFNLVTKGLNRFGVWSGLGGPKGEFISYRAIVFPRRERPAQTKMPAPGPYPETVGKEEQELAERLTAGWKSLEPAERLRVAAWASMGKWATFSPSPGDLRSWSGVGKEHGKLTSLLVLLRASGLAARVKEGLPLIESVAGRTLTWIEVWTGKEWERLNEDGEFLGRTQGFLALTTGGVPAVQISGGEMTEIRWSLSRQVMSQWRLHFESIRHSGRFLDRWSLLRLPQDFQKTFRILLLVPIGALMICVLRNIVGFPTFGIFMPVLMALAFRNTGLPYGLGIFAGVVLIGYAVRRAVDRLHLLLVPRLSVILTLVIASFTVLAMLGNRFGLRSFMAVGLLPFVILTMTIERFFVIMEEEGVRQGLKTAFGSAVVATITYELLHVEPLQLTFFIYPELLFAVAGAQVLIGRYTGYRLSELLRFRRFGRSP